jgi:hypothetical protein
MSNFLRIRPDQRRDTKSAPGPTPRAWIPWPRRALCIRRIHPDARTEQWADARDSAVGTVRARVPKRRVGVRGFDSSYREDRYHTQCWSRIWYDKGIMNAARKITVEVPRALLEKAQQASGTGVTQTVRTGLQLLAASRTYARLRRLRGKVRFSRTLAELKADR